MNAARRYCLSNQASVLTHARKPIDRPPPPLASRRTHGALARSRALVCSPHRRRRAHAQGRLGQRHDLRGGGLHGPAGLLRGARAADGGRGYRDYLHLDAARPVQLLLRAHRGARRERQAHLQRAAHPGHALAAVEDAVVALAHQGDLRPALDALQARDHGSGGRRGRERRVQHRTAQALFRQAAALGALPDHRQRRLRRARSERRRVGQRRARLRHRHRLVCRQRGADCGKARTRTRVHTRAHAHAYTRARTRTRAHAHARAFIGPQRPPCSGGRAAA